MILAKGSEIIEFDVFFARLSLDESFGADVTINFRSSQIAHNGTFYTDANALRMIRRQANATRSYPVNIKENKKF